MPPLPVAGPQFVINRAVARLLRRHPDLSDGLASLGGARIGIDPVDLPLALLLDCRSVPPAVTLLRDLGPGQADAVIRGSFVTLIDLCDGRLDGDAAFFSRRLTFEGGAAAVVGLRNALDGADLDLGREFKDWAALLPPPLRALAALVAGGAGRLLAVRRRLECEAAR